MNVLYQTECRETRHYNRFHIHFTYRSGIGTQTEQNTGFLRQVARRDDIRPRIQDILQYSIAD